MPFTANIIHPRFGEQFSQRDTLTEILQWLSYMIAFHEVEVVSIYEGDKEVKVYTIPQW